MQLLTITVASLSLLTPISASPVISVPRANNVCVTPPTAAGLTAILQSLTQKTAALQNIAQGIKPSAKRADAKERDVGIGSILPIGGSNSYTGLINGLKDIVSTAQSAGGATSGCPTGNPLSAADALIVCNALANYTAVENSFINTVTSKAGGMTQTASLQPVAVTLTLLRVFLDTLIGNIASAIPGCSTASSAQTGMDAGIQQAICAYSPLSKLLHLC